MIRAVSKQGFTLIELMLSMSFISVLLIAIALTIIQISNIYNHGLTIKDVNQSARSISSELQSGISQAVPFSIASGTGSHYIQSAWGGRLCVGQYSYIWNYGVNINNAITTNNYSDSNLNVYVTTPSTIIRFVKVPDTNAVYCTQTNGKYPDIASTNAVDLLNAGDHSLAIHSFSIASAAGAIDAKTNERLYTISFLIGTNDQNALVSGSTSCKPPSVSGADPTYCSVQQFTLAVRAGNAIR
jgi:Tfp pilus assembly protein FimT